MKKVAYLTGSRADFGLMKKILHNIDADKNLELVLIAAGMHLLDEFGATIKEVKREFPKVKTIDAAYETDDRPAMARFVGKCFGQIVETLNQTKPNVVLVLGDRGEQLAMAVAAAYLALPVIHLHGGETTTTIDNKARNAISQLADWHLPASKGAAKKLRQMRIDKHRIKIVGAPGLDQIKAMTTPEKRDNLLVLQHPDADERAAAWQIEQTLSAVLEFKLPVKVIYPNSDAGGRAIIEIIEKYKNDYPQLIKTYPNISRDKFLLTLNQARVLIGNSSAGLIEAPSLSLPVVNVGPRQRGREQAKNVINVDYNRKQIVKAVSKALGWRLNNVKNPYGDGRTGERVIKFLKSL